MSTIDYEYQSGLIATVDSWLAQDEAGRARIVLVPAFESLLHLRYGMGGLKGGTPVIVKEIERVIDTRPCEPLRPEDCEHDEVPFLGFGGQLYGDAYGPFPYDDAERPSSPRVRRDLASSMPSSWFQHLKWSLARRWPRLFGRLEVRWRAS